MNRYLINGKSFRTQADIKNHFSKILNESEVNADLNGDELGDCIGLFERHPDWETKKGSGVASIRVELNKFYTTRGFSIFRTDGSTADISYLKCISGKKNTKRKDFTSAARSAIAHQIVKFKDREFGESLMVRCKLTGRLVSKDSCDVDHVVPFREILSWFIERSSIDLKSVKYRDLEDGVIDFACDSLADEWQRFHASHAKLQIVCRQAHKEKERNQKR